MCHVLWGRAAGDYLGISVGRYACRDFEHRYLLTDDLVQVFSAARGSCGAVGIGYVGTAAKKRPFSLSWIDGPGKGGREKGRRVEGVYNTNGHHLIKGFRQRRGMEADRPAHKRQTAHRKGSQKC